MKYVTLVPAYGADYKSAAEARAAWFAGKDFTITDMHHPNDGEYVNIEAAPSFPNAVFNIRYQRLTRVTVVKPGETT